MQNMYHLRRKPSTLVFIDDIKPENNSCGDQKKLSQLRWFLNIRHGIQRVCSKSAPSPDAILTT